MKTKQKIEEVEREIEKLKETQRKLSKYIKKGEDYPRCQMYVDSYRDNYGKLRELEAQLKTLKECEKDVKEAVRRLRKVVGKEGKVRLHIRISRVIEEIDKIFGDKLVEGEQEK